MPAFNVWVGSMHSQLAVCQLPVSPGFGCADVERAEQVSATAESRCSGAQTTRNHGKSLAGSRASPPASLHFNHRHQGVIGQHRKMRLD